MRLKLQSSLSMSSRNINNTRNNEDLNNVDLAKMIQDTSKEVKIALYNLSTAIHDIQPKELTPGFFTEIDVTEGVPSLYKIYCKDMKPPLKILISYLSEIKGNLFDLKNILIKSQN